MHPTTHEFWNIWSTLLPLTILTYLMFLHLSLHPTPLSTGVHVACVTCQLCSFIYHTFNSISPRVSRALYNLDLAGICCMSLGAPWLYASGYGEDGLEIYTVILFSLMTLCLLLLAKATILDQEPSQHWILVLSAVGNYPSLAHPTATAAALVILTGYIFFYRLRLPDRFLPSATGKLWSSHVLWHCAVFAGQLGFVYTTQ